MTRPTRAARIAGALAGTAGAAIALAGCATATTSNADSTAGSGDGTSQTSAASQSVATDSAAQYKNGTYTAAGTYQTPQSVEKVTVTLTLGGDTVTAVKVTGNPQTSETVHYQGEFVAGISNAIVGKKIEDLAVTRVGGSSLTSAGFNDALAKIEAQAKA